MRKIYYNPYQYPYYVNAYEYNYERHPSYRALPDGPGHPVNYNYLHPSNGNFKLTDYGSKPFVVNINEAAKRNNTYRTAIWTGTHLQVTLMSIDVRDDISLEVHPDHDQFLRIEEGQGFVQMGSSKDQLNFERYVGKDSAIMIPAGTWHNVTNTGNIPLKLYSIYAPPEHPFGTVHVSKEGAIAAEEGYR